MAIEISKMIYHLLAFPALHLHLAIGTEDDLFCEGDAYQVYKCLDQATLEKAKDLFLLLKPKYAFLCLTSFGIYLIYTVIDPTSIAATSLTGLILYLGLQWVSTAVNIKLINEKLNTRGNNHE